MRHKISAILESGKIDNKGSLRFLTNNNREINTTV